MGIQGLLVEIALNNFCQHAFANSRRSNCRIWTLAWPRKDKRGFDLITDALPFGRLWYEQAPDAIGYAKFYGRSVDAVIRVYDMAGKLIEVQRHKGDFKEP